mmetsp:Transcript_48857/g.116149  ORF Transcript_48857/g.116149 Transcript_48857/m.116149 type:complete len:158 (+) Transcript_48857:83-556(+)
MRGRGICIVGNAVLVINALNTILEMEQFEMGLANYRALTVLDIIVLLIGCILMHASEGVPTGLECLGCSGLPLIPWIILGCFMVACGASLLILNDVNGSVGPFLIAIDFLETGFLGTFSIWWLSRFKTQEGHYGCGQGTSKESQARQVQLDEFGLDG